MTINIEILRETSSTVIAHREKLHQLFYHHLAALAPDLEQKLGPSDRQSTRALFDAALEAMLTSFQNPDQLEERIGEIARTNLVGRIPPDYLGTLATALVEALAELFGHAWTGELAAAWEESVGLVRILLRQAYESSPEESDTPQPRASSIIR